MAFERSTQRRLLLWLCAAKLAALILLFDPQALVAFQLPKALASRAFEWLIAATLLWAFVAFGRSILRPSRLHWAVAAVVVASAISAVFAADPYVALFGDPENCAGLTFVVDMAVLYVALAVAVRSERDASLLIGAIGAAGGVAVAYGAVQALGADPFDWAVDSRARPFATFGNPDHFGHFLSVLFGLALGLALAGRERARLIGVPLGAVVIAVAAVVATRGTLLGVAAAFAGALLIRAGSRRSMLALAGVAAALAVVLAATPVGQRALFGATADRVTLFTIAARATLARPVFGYGTDGFRVAFVQHRTAASVATLGGGPQSTAHDWILDASATTGIVGLAALALLVALGSIALWRLVRARPVAGAPLFLAWLAYWAHALVAAVSLAGSWYPFVALGVAAALASPDTSGAPVRAVPRWVIALLAFAALAGAVSGARAWQADRDAWSSEEAAHFGDTDGAVLYADRAAARDPGRADYWDRLGLAFDAAGRRDAAVAAYREATVRAPFEPVYWSNLARALARTAGSDAAKRAEAIMAAQRAASVDPNAPVGHVTLADIAIAFSRCDLARPEAVTAAALEAGHDDLVGRAIASCP